MTANPSISTRIGAGAHTGKVREENQDRISRLRCPFGDVFLVVDGMGGHQGGGIAAQMLIHGMETHLQALPPETPPEEALRVAAVRTNTEIHRQANSGDPQTAKMGATCVLALLNGRRVLIAHAGDSRAYLLRSGQLSPLTRDHTVVQRMLEHNMLTEEEARHHPDANIVTRAFGQKPEVELEISVPFDLFPGDRLLLCSDGLCGYVEDAAIQRALESENDAQAATDRLIDLALQAGGEDNVSVQVIAVDEAASTAAYSAPVQAAVPKQRQRRGIPTWMPIAALTMMVIAVATLLPPVRSFFIRGQGEPAGETMTSDTPIAEEIQNEAEEGQESFKSTYAPPLDPKDEAEEPAGLAPVPNPSPEEEKKPEPEFRSLIGLVGKIREGFRENFSVPNGNIRFIAEEIKPPFQEGNIYFRAGSKALALKTLSELRKQGETGYRLMEWPKDRPGDHNNFQVLVSLKAPKSQKNLDREVRQQVAATDTGKNERTVKVEQPERNVVQQPPADSPEPKQSLSGNTGERPSQPEQPTRVEESSPKEREPPREERRTEPELTAARQEATVAVKPVWLVLAPKPSRSQKPDKVDDRISKQYKGNWSKPERLPDREKTLLQPGHVYYQGDYGKQAADVAGEMGYKATPWPVDVLRFRDKCHILVVLKVIEADAKKKKDRSDR